MTWQEAVVAVATRAAEATEYVARMIVVVMVLANVVKCCIAKHIARNM